MAARPPPPPPRWPGAPAGPAPLPDPFRWEREPAEGDPPVAKLVFVVTRSLVPFSIWGSSPASFPHSGWGGVLAHGFVGLSESLAGGKQHVRENCPAEDLSIGVRDTWNHPQGPSA